MSTEWSLGPFSDSVGTGIWGSPWRTRLRSSRLERTVNRKTNPLLVGRFEMPTSRVILLVACVQSTLVTAATNTSSCVEPRAQLATAVALVTSLETQLEAARRNVVAKELEARHCETGTNTLRLVPETESDAASTTSGGRRRQTSGTVTQIPRSVSPCSIYRFAVDAA